MSLIYVFLAPTDSSKALTEQVKLMIYKILSTLAKMYGLKVWNTWTILLEALSKGLIKPTDIESAIDELGEPRHKLTAEQAAEILKAAKHFASRKRG